MTMSDLERVKTLDSDTKTVKRQVRIVPLVQSEAALPDAEVVKRRAFDAVMNPDQDDRLLSVVDLSRQSLDWSKNLLGWRWLERECGALVVAPSGAGKSVLDVQAAICWSCGRDAFGIKCEQPLRQIIFQHEDRWNDMIEMSRIVGHLKLTPDERELVHTNLRIKRLTGFTDGAFIEVVSRCCDDFRSDLIHVNPMAVYMGKGFQDDDSTMTFLYKMIDPMLRKYNCGLFGIVHIPKPANKTTAPELSLTQQLYAMSGRSWWTNWARATINISPVADEEEKVYRFQGGKRWDRLGWEGRSTLWRWNPAQANEREKALLWLPATDTQTVDAIDSKRISHDDLLLLFPEPPKFVTTDWMYGTVNLHRAENNNRVSKDRIREMLDALANDGKASKTKLQRPQGGAAEVRFTRSFASQTTPLSTESRNITQIDGHFQPVRQPFYVASFLYLCGLPAGQATQSGNLA